MQNIRYQDQMSPEYRDLIGSVAREQAARTLQRHTRRYLAKQGMTVSIPKAKKVTRSDSIFSLVQEPKDETYLTHTNLIKTQKYLDLDFSDPQFVRNLYKGLRLGEITKKQMLKALFIYQAKEWLHGYDYSGRQLHSLSLRSPCFSYIFNNQELYPEGVIEQFFSQLNSEDMQGITINFPRQQEKYFFMLGEQEISHPTFKALLPIYKQREYPPLSHYDRRNIDSLTLLLLGLNNSQTIPLFTISPDFDPNNPDSPLVCFILLAPEAERQLQLALGYGAETTLSEFVACPVTLSQIRAFDEQPWTPRNLPCHDQDKSMRQASAATIMQSLYGFQYHKLTQHARPVEITHPDIMKTENVHGFEVYDFHLTSHDRFHIWENAEFYKPLVRHVRTLLTRRGVCHEKDFIMSKALWNLTDLSMEKKYFNGYKDERKAILFFYTLLDVTVRNNGKIVLDVFLLILIDMIKNPQIWRDFFVQAGAPNLANTPLELGLLEMEPLRDHKEIKSDFHHGDFSEIALLFKYAFEDKQMLSVIESNLSKPNEYLILRCWLKDDNLGQTRCDEIYKRGLKQFFYWTPNGGLRFKETFHPVLRQHFNIDTFDLESLSKDKLLKDALAICLQTTASLENKPRFFSTQPPAALKKSSRMDALDTFQM